MEWAFSLIHTHHFHLKLQLYLWLSVKLTIPYTKLHRFNNLTIWNLFTQRSVNCYYRNDHVYEQPCSYKPAIRSCTTVWNESTHSEKSDWKINNRYRGANCKRRVRKWFSTSEARSHFISNSKFQTHASFKGSQIDQTEKSWRACVLNVCL